MERIEQPSRELVDQIKPDEPALTLAQEIYYYKHVTKYADECRWEGFDMAAIHKWRKSIEAKLVIEGIKLEELR